MTAASEDPGKPQDAISLSLREHNISFTLPFGARLEGRLLLPGGALIFGDFIGDIFCESGSVIVKKGARYQGMAEADQIYIEGEVSSLDEKRRSTLIARRLVACSSTSRVNADVFSASFALHKAKIWGTMRTLEEAEPFRRNNKAISKLLPNSGAQSQAARA